MQKIITHLWYNKEALEAAQFYTSLFNESSIDRIHKIENTPSGDAESIYFTLAGLSFAAISAGPYFRFNPSASLVVSCTSVEEVNTLWNAFIDGGTSTMELGEYPFSKRYGWLTDRYGLSWQLMISAGGLQKITPNLLFSGSATGKAEDAIRFYTEIFPSSAINHVSRYADGEASSSMARINYAAVTLAGSAFTAMDNGIDVEFNFNEAVSFIIQCTDQSEIDYFWDKLSAVPEAEQCGWVKDRFGVSWQIVPENLETLLFGGNQSENRRVTDAMLQMKKLDIAVLQKARG